MVEKKVSKIARYFELKLFQIRQQQQAVFCLRSIKTKYSLIQKFKKQGVIPVLEDGISKAKITKECHKVILRLEKQYDVMAYMALMVNSLDGKRKEKELVVYFVSANPEDWRNDRLLLRTKGKAYSYYHNFRDSSLSNFRYVSVPYPIYDD